MSNSPGSQPETPQPRNFNWQALIGVSILLIVLGMAFTKSTSLETRDLSYPAFEAMRDQGRVIRNDAKYPLLVETSDVPNNAVISGFLKPAQVEPAQGAKVEPYRFHVTLLAKDAENVRALLGNSLLVVMPSQISTEEPSREISYADFRYAWSQREIDLTETAQQKLRLSVGPNGTYMLFGTRKEVTNRVAMVDPKSGKELGYQPFRVKASTSLQREELGHLITDWNVEYAANSDWLRSAIFAYILPLGLVGLLMYFLFRQQMKSAGKGAMSFGKSKARLLMIDKNRVTFQDVAGIQEAKEELYEIVDFLSNPTKFQRLGAAIPKGVLMVGSPGTGKTLLARAIAGEANVPFFSISGSDFVEMFVGVGASRVRDMFEQGRKNAPCLIFIDEIDAVGRHRGHGLGGGHDEREQTLNQLLVEMDGFDSQEGVIIIAATNRPDVLDPALLRPGRFDRRVTVSLPDVNGREEILKVHAKKIKIQTGVDLGVIARGTPGFSGAELANLLNEAALHAARKGLSEVTLEEMEEARDKIRWGRERRSMAMTEHEKNTTAWHEAGHAYLSVILDHTHPLHKVTIIPRGPYLGATMFLPERDSISMQRKEALSNLIMTMGGRIAEKFYSDDISNGASGDIRQATALSRKMVCEWGMSDKLGMVEYSEGDGEVFLARDISRPRNYSDETARLIDSEVKNLIDTAYAEAVRLLTEGREKVQLLAEALVKYETLDGAQIEELIKNGFMQNPPKLVQPPALPSDTKPSAPKRDAEDGPDEGTPIPILVDGVPTT